MKILILLFLCLSVANGEMFFHGFPDSKTEAGPEKATQTTISEIEAPKFDLLIHKLQGIYYWKTRGNRELTASQSGIYITFVDPQGGGYMKINTTDGTYFECISMGISTITYWGGLGISGKNGYKFTREKPFPNFSSSFGFHPVGGSL